jgi:hypothetical protein
LADLLGRWGYRARQFFSALLGKVSEDDMAKAGEVLGPHLFPMFAEMPTQYRRHAITVYRRVLEGPSHSPEILQAALLHDAGKYDPSVRRSVTLGHRVAIVLLRAVPPGRHLLSRLARHDNPRGLTGYLLFPFYLSKHHAQIAASRAALLGAEPDVVSLIANHHRCAHSNEALALLQAADEAS